MTLDEITKIEEAEEELDDIIKTYDMETYQKNLRKNDSEMVSEFLADKANSSTLYQAIKELKLEIIKCKELVQMWSEIYTEQVKNGEKFYAWSPHGYYGVSIYYNRAVEQKEKLERQLKILEWQRKICLGKVDDDKLEFAKRIEIAKQVPIGDILQTPESNGSRAMGFYLCPIHNEKTESLCWYKKDNRFKCFGCNQGGDVIDLYMKVNNVTFNEAIRQLCHASQSSTI